MEGLVCTGVDDGWIQGESWVHHVIDAICKLQIYKSVWKTDSFLSDFYTGEI